VIRLSEVVVESGRSPAERAAPMPRRGAGVRGAVVVLGGQAGGQALGFLRNLILAHALAASDFGVATTFVVTIALLNMLGDLSLDKLLVQASDGDDPLVQRTAQAIQFGRGLVSGALLLLAAPLVASAFGAPQARWAFQALAIVPVLRGFAHLDVRRIQRDLRFTRATLTDGVPQLLSTLAVWPLALWLGDWRAVLVAILAQEMLATALSHAFAERRYGWAMDRAVARRIARFGLPLLVNALLMFGIFQGDRVVVGTSYGLDLLGAYSLAFLLTMVPTALLAGAGTALVLPILSRVQNDALEFGRRTAACAQTLALAAAAVTIPLALLGGTMLTLLFGTKYAAAAEVVPWLALMQGVRILRVTPTLAAVARADTMNSMLANVWRTTALGGMAVAAALHAPLPWIAAAGLGGEILALLYSCARLARRQSVPMRVNLAPATIAFCGGAAALGCALLLGTASRAALAVLATLAVQSATVAALFVCFPALRASAVEGLLAAARRVGIARRVGSHWGPQP
jgi:O-antigen/teichoic acid export membrane protein